MQLFWNRNLGDDIDRIVRFIKTDIWRIQSKNIPRMQAVFIKPARVILLTIHGFWANQCPIRASALTFYTVLSIVPVAAMAFGIAKGFGFEKVLRTQMLDKFPGQEKIISQVIGFATNLLENTRGGMIAGIGLIVLFWAVIKVLGHIERSFNDIWGIKHQRSFVRKFSDYISIIFLCPVLVILSSSATVFIHTQITHIINKISLLGMISPFIFFILKLSPLALLWILFTFIYIVMPNTKVHFSSGLPAGILAGSIYQTAQWAYIDFQIGVSKYNAIYGSFAALPLFLIWIQLSWFIVLLGAQLSFAWQNADDYEFHPESINISISLKKRLALQISHLVVHHFAAGKRALTAPEIADTLDIPIRMVRQILYELVEGGIFSNIKDDLHEESSFQPARDIHLISLKSILDALENIGSKEIPSVQTEARKKISEAMETFGKTIENSPANALIKDI
jgi:membrane protein